MMGYHGHFASKRTREMLKYSTTRRRLLGKVLGAGLALPALSLLAGCDDGDTVDPAMDPVDTDDDLLDDPEDDEDIDEAANGQRGGRINVATRASIDMMEPHLRFTIEDVFANMHLYSGLVRAGVDLEPVPDLATSWDSNDEGDEWTFEVREGVRFHNGREFTAQDVADSFERLLDPETGAAFRVQVSMIEEIEIPDDATAIFRLNRPYGGFPTLLSNDFAMIVPVEEAETLAEQPVGTGPYRLDQHMPAERTVLVRNDDYWDPDNPPYLDEIHFIVMGEESTMLTALQGGDIDLLVDVTGPSVQMVEAVDNVENDEVITGSHLTVIMAADEDPWNDVRVRQALKLTVDREGVLEAAVQGYGVTAADQPIPPIDPMYPDIPIPERDIERARELLAEAGYPDGIDLELHSSGGRVGMLEVALSVQEMAEEAGFRIEVQSHPIDTFWADIWMQVPMSVSNWNMRLPADQMLQVGFTSDADWNEGKWRNEEFDELVLEAQATPDPDDRREIITEACALLAEDGSIGIPIFRSGIDAWNTRVRNYQPHPMRWIDLNRVWIEE
jgi:peptide/nickel transport system substrate-binding protein